MVAYSFKAQFCEPIETLKKRQTVRGLRKRHARPEEPIQLYTAMRTKHCRKILTPDPICVSVKPISLIIQPNTEHLLQHVAIEGVELSPEKMEQFAIADGFGSAVADGGARWRMGAFWLEEHVKSTSKAGYPQPPALEFEGVVIAWRPNAAR